MTKIKVAVVGGSGYTGVELLRLLLEHPQVDLHAVTSRTEAGRLVTEVFPQFYGHTIAGALKFELPDISILQEADVVFFATPNGTAMQSAQALLQAGTAVIDLAADFRLDLDAWNSWYNMKHSAPELLPTAMYSLADLASPGLPGATLVANPGCYPTSVQLPLKPLLAAGLIDLTKPIIADCKSGITGAGRSGKVQHSFSEVSEDFTAYGVEGHRHWIEIKQGLEASAPAGTSLDFTFTPHLLPIPRGILSTIYCSLAKPGLQALAHVRATLTKTYEHSPFVQLLPVGHVPHTKWVRSSNKCHFNVFQSPSGQLVIISVIDNLMKGAAGQAIQNMNLMNGLPETLGLSSLGLVP